MPIDVIRFKIGSTESNTRSTLNAMLRLGLVEKVSIHRQGRKFKPITVGWKKTPLPQNGFE
jgi:hypothetical protein